MPQTDGRRTNFDFMSSADIVKQSYKCDQIHTEEAAGVIGYLLRQLRVLQSPKENVKFQVIHAERRKWSPHYIVTRPNCCRQLDTGNYLHLHRDSLAQTIDLCQKNTFSTGF